MYFKRRSSVLFRDFASFGYITDNRNFGYYQTNNNENHIGDKILSDSGTIFLSVLGRQPQSIDDIAINAKKQFDNVDISIIRKDAIEFFHKLEHDGFIVSGETPQECEERDSRFSYKQKHEIIQPEIIFHKKTTQDFFKEHFQDKPQLRSLHIEINSKCNERCLHCYIPHENKISEMESELFYNILEQCKEMRLLHITLSGGEPMLHKNFCDFLSKCYEKELSINVLSNLTRLDDKILEELKRNPLLGVQVSLYSMIPDTHDKITKVKGSFKKTKNAILKLIENDIPLQISCPIMKENKDSFNTVVKWAKKYKINVGADYVIIGRYDHSNQNLNHRLSIDEIDEVMQKVFLKDKKYRQNLKLTAEKKKSVTPEDYVCSVCNSSLCIAENGNVYPCPGWQDYIVGNVKKDSLKTIWNTSQKIHYLRNLRNKDFPKCIKCPDKEYCTMCMVRNANEDLKGDPLVVNDFFCRIAQLNKDLISE